MRRLSRLYLVVLLFDLTFLTACNHLVLNPADSTVTTTGKVIARGILLIPTFGASERRINRYRNGVPVTDGFHSRMSNGNETIVIVGNNNSANSAATIWLQKRGLSVLERSQLDQILAEQQLRLVHSSDDEAMLLHVGRLDRSLPNHFYRHDLFGSVHSSSGSGKRKDRMVGKRSLPGYENQRTGRSQHEIDLPGARHGMGIPRARRSLHSFATDVRPARHPTKGLIEYRNPSCPLFLVRCQPGHRPLPRQAIEAAHVTAELATMLLPSSLVSLRGGAGLISYCALGRAPSSSFPCPA